MMRIVTAAVLVIVTGLATAGHAETEQRFEEVMGGPEGGEMKVMSMQGGEMGEHARMGLGFFLRMENELGLDKEQVSKLRSMRLAQEKQAIKDGAELKIMELELRELLIEENIDLKSVDSSIDKIALHRAKMHKNRIHAMVDARKVLNADQVKKLKELRGSGRGVMKKRIEYRKMIKE